MIEQVLSCPTEALGRSKSTSIPWPNLSFFENSDRNRLVPKSFGFLPFWGNSGPVLGWKLTFFGHCTCMYKLKGFNKALIVMYAYIVGSRPAIKTRFIKVK